MRATVHGALPLVGLLTLGGALPANATLAARITPVASAAMLSVSQPVAKPWRYPGLFACRCTLKEAVDLAIMQQLFTEQVGEAIVAAYYEDRIIGKPRPLTDGEEFYSSFRHLNGSLGLNFIKVEFGPGWKGVSRWVYEWHIPGTDIELILPDACDNWSFKVVQGTAGGGYIPPVSQTMPPDTESGGPGIYWPPGPFDWFGPPGAFGSPGFSWPPFGWPSFPGGYSPPGGEQYPGAPPVVVVPPEKPPETTTIPEPRTLLVLLTGLVGIILIRKRRAS